jgi:hypothetical protein
MTISRRTVLAASAAAPVILAAGPAMAAAGARIAIHSERHRGEIDKKIFGNFIWAAASLAAYSMKARLSRTRKVSAPT